MMLVHKIDPLLHKKYSFTRIKRLIFKEEFLLQLFKKGLHPAYDIHSDEIPEECKILDVIFDAKAREFHIVIRSSEFSHVPQNESIPYLIPIAEKVKNAKSR